MGVSPTLDVVTTEAGVEAAIAEYARLEAAGWKGKSGTALAPENLQGQFYRQALARACRRGQGEIHRYCLGDSAVAMDLCLRDGATLIVLKTAYDEAFAKFSPASLMREEQLRRLFAGGVTRRVEFYGPVMDWHTRWTQDARMLYHVNCYRLPLLSWVHDLSVARRKRAPARPGAVV
jgi:endonuclease/exonuclease/phosphatase (EEP) superfamily protein YafD